MAILSVNELIALSIANGFIPANVSAKAAGVDVNMDVASFAPESITTALTYGLRRMLQDHVNAAAHTFKTAKADAEAKGETFNDGKDFDAAACVADRIAAFVSGELKARTGTAAPAFTEQEEKAYEIVCELRRDAGWGAIATAYSLSKGMPTSERKKAVLDTLATMPDDMKNGVYTEARESLERRKALRGIKV
jgi:hypothetical protein